MQEDPLEPSTEDAGPLAEGSPGPAFEPAADGEEGAYAELAGEPTAESPHGNRRRALAALAIVVVVVLLVGGLAFSGNLGTVLSPGHGSPGAVSSVSFSSAYTALNGSVQSTPGGPWVLFSASGIDVPANGSYPNNLGLGSTGACSVKPPPPLVHSGPTDAIRGLSPYWAFSFESAAGGTTLSAVVVNGEGEVLGTQPLTLACGGTLIWGTLPPVRGIEDSTQFAPALPNLNLFSRSYPNSTVVFYLSDEVAASGRASGVAFWAVFASPCLSSGISTSTPLPPGDPYYEGASNATSSQALGDSIIAGIGSCEIPGSLGASLQVGAPQLASAGSGYGYRSNVQESGNGLTPEMFHPVVVASESYSPAYGSASSAVTGFVVLGANGSAIAVYNITVGAWTVGGGTPLMSLDTLELLSSRLIDGAVLVLVATPPATGDIGLNLP
jgi:hypothetical protein